MSHEATAWARAQKTGNSGAKFVLLLLADRAGTDYSCWPSVASIADETEMGESTVRAATKLLADLGLIRVYYRHRNGSHLRRSSRYQLLVDGPDTAEPDADDWASQRQISAVDHRQDSAVDMRQDSAVDHRQDSALIPYKEPSLKEPSLGTTGAPRTAKATRIPDEFYPTPEMQTWFRQENLHTVITDPRGEHESFCDYWRGKAGADARKVDWPATWRNWMRRAAKNTTSRGFTPSGAAGAYRSTTDTKVQQTLDLAEKFRQQEKNQ